MENDLAYQIGYLIGILICCYPVYAFFRKLYISDKNYKIVNSFNTWLRKEMKTLGLYDNNFIMDKFNFHANGAASLLVYTNDKRLYYFDINKVFKEIDLSSILDVKIDRTVNVKNVKRLIALTSTYDTRSSALAHLTIITEDRNYVVNNLPDSNELHRFKLVLEKYIKELNNVSN